MSFINELEVTLIKSNDYHVHGGKRLTLFYSHIINKLHHHKNIICQQCVNNVNRLLLTMRTHFNIKGLLTNKLN